MPRTEKKNKDLLLDEFPALTRLLEEISQHRENERVQPRLPFEQSLASKPSKAQRRPGAMQKKFF